MIVAVDMQKVVQLPRMESLKRVIFARQIVAFNETFTPVEKAVTAVLWHEGIAGRGAEELLSAYIKYLISHGSKNSITICIDNKTKI